MVEPTGMKRKLAVILAADVEGYSRLVGADEEGMLKTLNAYRKIFDRVIAQYANEPLCSEGRRAPTQITQPQIDAELR